MAVLLDLLLDPRKWCWPIVFYYLYRDDNWFAIEVALDHDVDLAFDAQDLIHQELRFCDGYPRLGKMLPHQVHNALKRRCSLRHCEIIALRSAPTLAQPACYVELSRCRTVRQCALPARCRRLKEAAGSRCTSTSR